MLALMNHNYYLWALKVLINLKIRLIVGVESIFITIYMQVG